MVWGDLELVLFALPPHLLYVVLGIELFVCQASTLPAELYSPVPKLPL